MYEMLPGNTFMMFQVHFTLPVLPSCGYYTIHGVEYVISYVLYSVD